MGGPSIHLVETPEFQSLQSADYVRPQVYRREGAYDGSVHVLLLEIIHDHSRDGCGDGVLS